MLRQCDPSQLRWQPFSPHPPAPLPGVPGRGEPRDLILRAGTSIGANVEEGQARQSRADFAAKYAIACKEARETHYWLRLLAASEVVPQARLVSITAECSELIAILTTIVKKAKSQPANKTDE